MSKLFQKRLDSVLPDSVLLALQVLCENFISVEEARELLIRLKVDKIKKSAENFRFRRFERRERDSNPRYLAVQRFSRPPHSTTLPSLQCGLAVELCFSIAMQI